MSKARKEAARKKSVAQKAAKRANRIRSLATVEGRPGSKEPAFRAENAPDQSCASHQLFDLATKAPDETAFKSDIELLRQAIRLDPMNPELFVSLGVAYANTEQHDFALAACERAIKLDPNHTLAQKNRSYALKALGLPESTTLST
jgi:cytochrome c-type biogenesis protein CcmH/NrfG